MAINWANVTDIAAELSTVPIGAQTAILAYVNSALVESMFNTAALAMARVYLAAHLGTTTKQNGSAVAGPVVSESADGLSRTYAVIASSVVSSFGSTPYGVNLQWMIDTSKARLPVVLR